MRSPRNHFHLPSPIPRSHGDCFIPAAWSTSRVTRVTPDPLATPLQVRVWSPPLMAHPSRASFRALTIHRPSGGVTRQPQFSKIFQAAHVGSPGPMWVERWGEWDSRSPIGSLDWLPDSSFCSWPLAGLSSWASPGLLNSAHSEATPLEKSVDYPNGFLTQTLLSPGGSVLFFLTFLHM